MELEPPWLRRSLNKITRTGRGKQIADGAVAFAGQIRQAADQSGIAAVELDLVIVGLALGAANVIAEQKHMYLFGEPLALFAAVWSLVDCAGLVNSISIGAVDHLVQAGLDLSLR